MVQSTRNPKTKVHQFTIKKNMKTHHTQIIPLLIIRNYRDSDIESVQIIPFQNKDLRKRCFKEQTKRMKYPNIEENIHRFETKNWTYEYEFVDMVFGEKTDLKIYRL